MKNKRQMALLYPALIVVSITSLIPLIYTIFLSFQRWRMSESPDPGPFVGLDNFKLIIADPDFWTSVWTTLKFTALSVVITFFLAMVMALLLQRPGKLHLIAKITLIFPYAISPALKGYTWRFMLNPNFGIYNEFLQTIFPFADGIIWLSDKNFALLFLAIAESWGWAPMIALMFIGALGNISPSIYEAARLDGVSSFQLFRRITLPLLKPIITTALLLKIIYALKIFDMVNTMTGGGPGGSTQTLNFYVYLTGFGTYNMGKAAAMAVVLLILIGFVTYLYVRAILKKDKSGGLG